MTTNREFLERISKLSPKRLALLAIELNSKLEKAENQRPEPIAVVGMGCRFPGSANSPEAYWQLMVNGIDAITEIPADRFNVDDYYDPDPNTPGKMATRWGGYVDNIDKFDPQLFGIAPREAVTMDPQQRMLLEVSWEALERAGYAPDSLDGYPGGVFVGVCNSDYHQIAGSDLEQIDVYLATGSAHSVASGRLSYVLGMQGPAVSVDTACSSSLVSLHLAIQSLRNQECNMALAAGVNALLSPKTTVTLSQANMMSADGRCKAFDDSADGFVRSEGCGVVVLKRLADAQADGDQILAVIRGSAMNQDGRSNGLTAPNGPSQESVIRAALANGNLKPEDVTFIETHGTGTSLGDPIEVQALGAVYGPGHSSENPLLLGSVKTNIGHLESAAGIAGFIKLVLVLNEKKLPPHLHFNKPNALIPWDDFPVVVPTDGMNLAVENASTEPGRSSRLIGGVSSFGFSGTNVHILAEAPPKPNEKPEQEERPWQLLTLSAKSKPALEQLSKQFADYFAAHPDTFLADAAYTLNTGRANLSHRLAITADNLEAAQSALAEFGNGKVNKKLATYGKPKSTKRPPVVFLFTGQGGQYLDMGRQLYDTQPIFKQAIDQCDTILQSLGWKPLLPVLYADAAGTDANLINEIAYAQPSVFSIQYALVQLWKSWGVEPDVVLGHSNGEYAAAHTAGVFSLEDALKLVVTRGRLMQSLPPTGAMAAVFAGADKVNEAIAASGVDVAIAGVNGPDSTVISGEETAVSAVIAQLKQSKIRARRVAVSVGAHSNLMDPVLGEFEQTASIVTYHTPQIEFLSTVTNNFVTDEIATATYWRNHMREGVQFYPAMKQLFESGYEVFLEIGPAPMLLGMGQRCNPPETAVWLPSLRPGHEDWRQLLRSLGELYTTGASVNWAGLDKNVKRQRLTLPTYPFQRERYWVEYGDEKRPLSSGSLIGNSTGHPLLGQQLQSPAFDDIVFETQLSEAWPSFLAHHRVFDSIILPSPAFIEMLLAAAESVWGQQPYHIRNFTIQEALTLSEKWQRVQLLLSVESDKVAAFKIVSLDGDDWKTHVSGTLEWSDKTTKSVAPTLDLTAIQARCTEEITQADYYQQVADLGLEFGTDFRGLNHIWRQDGEALGRVELPENLLSDARQYHIHPAFLDACFHLVGAPIPKNLDDAFLLVGIEDFQLHHIPGSLLWNHTILQQQSGNTFTSDVYLYDDAGTLIAEARGLHLKKATLADMQRNKLANTADWLYEVTWQPKPHPTGTQVDLPAPSSLSAAVSPLAEPLAAKHKLEVYKSLSPDLDALSLNYIVAAFKTLGWSYRSGTLLTTKQVSDEVGIVAQHQRLSHRLLAILAEAGVLKPSGDGWEVIGELETAVTPITVTSLQAKYPSQDAELQLLAQCGPHLAQVLNGTQDPLHLLFPDGDLAATTRVYSETAYAHVFQALAGKTAKALVGGAPERQLRVLEIGAGTGATTAQILPQFNNEQTEYTFTDMSPLFLKKAQEKFTNYPFIKYELLDIAQSPEGQGFAPHQFDVVVAANVLHATADLKQTLAHVKQFLVPNGLLILMEGSGRDRWVDLTFGLTEGWWKFTDQPLRITSPLLKREAWLELLQAEGFNVNAIPESAPDSLLAEQTIFVAQTPTPETPRPMAEANWLIFGEDRGIGRLLTENLQTANQNVILVKPGKSLQKNHQGHYSINPANQDEYKQLLEIVFTDQRSSPTNIIHLWSIDSPDNDTLTLDNIETAQSRSVSTALFLTQALGQQKPNGAKLWFVTKNAQPVQATPDCIQTPLWGLGRVVALEHPEFWGGLIDLDTTNTPSINAEKVWLETAVSDGEDQIAWRGQQRLVARLERTEPAEASPLTLTEEGTYLLTGGMGGLGLNIARWLANNGVKHLVLTSRSGLPPRDSWDSLPDDSPHRHRITAVQEIEQTGATVYVAKANVSSQTDMETLFAQFGQSLPALRGVLHTAVAMTSWPLATMPEDGLNAMMRSKVTGSWLLHELTKDLNLDFFVLFSSTTALWGVNGLGHYAAANQFMDSLAHMRQATGLPAISINWGTWEEMRVASEDEQQQISEFGLKQMPMTQALAILGNYLGVKDKPQVVVANVEWQTLKSAYEAKRPKPFLANVEDRRPQPKKKSTKAESTPQLQQQVAGKNAEERRRIVVAEVKNAVADVLGTEVNRLTDTQQGLFDMGMDSLMSVELKSHLETAVGQTLPSTLTFNYPTIDDLSEYLDTEILAETEVEENEPEDDAVTAVLSAVEQDMETDLDDEDLSEDDLAALLLQTLDQLD